MSRLALIIGLALLIMICLLLRADTPIPDRTPPANPGKLLAIQKCTSGIFYAPRIETRVVPSLTARC